MTDFDDQTTLPLPKVFEVYMQLANYPILADRVRRKMREEVFARGVIARKLFEQEVEDKAVTTQLVTICAIIPSVSCRIGTSVVIRCTGI